MNRARVIRAGNPDAYGFVSFHSRGEGLRLLLTTSRHPLTCPSRARDEGDERQGSRGGHHPGALPRAQVPGYFPHAIQIAPWSWHAEAPGERHGFGKWFSFFARDRDELWLNISANRMREAKAPVAPKLMRDSVRTKTRKAQTSGRRRICASGWNESGWSPKGRKMHG